MTEMNDTAYKKNQKKNGAGIGVAAIGGGGIGTVLVAISNFFPEHNPWRSFLVTIAPAISVAMSSFWIWAIAELQRYRKEKIAIAAIFELREYLIGQINSNNVTPEMKKRFEKQLLQLDEKNLEKVIQLIES